MGSEKPFGPLQIFRSVNPHRLSRCNTSLYTESVFKPTQLFKRLGQFETALGKSGNTLEDIGTIGIQAYVFIISM